VVGNLVGEEVGAEEGIGLGEGLGMAEGLELGIRVEGNFVGLGLGIWDGL
jgi:hypothetical protein